MMTTTIVCLRKMRYIQVSVEFSMKMEITLHYV